MIRSPEELPLSRDVNRTSRTCSETSSRLWRERVRTSWVGSVSHLPLGVLSFVVPLHSTTDPPFGFSMHTPGWDTLATVGHKRGRSLCRVALGAHLDSFQPFSIRDDPPPLLILLRLHSSSPSASSCSSTLFTFASSSDNLSFSFYGFLNTLIG